MVKELSTLSYWNDIHKTNISRFYPNPSKYLMHFELNTIFNKYLPKDKGKKLIEMGCGKSIWLPYFFKTFGYKVFGLDYSVEGCRLASFFMKRSQAEGEIICRNFLNFRDKNYLGQFDFLISFGVVEHFESPAEIICLFLDYLKSGGKIITIVPNMKGFLGKIQKIIDGKIYFTHKIFSLKDLIEFHKLFGLKIIYSSYIDFLDLSMINFSKFSPSNQKLIGRLITAFNLPVLYLSKILNLHINNSTLSSYMVVIMSK